MLWFICTSNERKELCDTTMRWGGKKQLKNGKGRQKRAGLIKGRIQGLLQSICLLVARSEWYRVVSLMGGCWLCNQKTGLPRCWHESRNDPRDSRENAKARGLWVVQPLSDTATIIPRRQCIIQFRFLSLTVWTAKRRSNFPTALQHLTSLAHLSVYPWLVLI